jgi:cytochrome c oxidase subunit 2
VRRAPLPIAEWKVETVWLFGTTAGFLGFFFWGSSIYLDAEHAPAGADEIVVVGRQWMWDVRHPNGRREFDELHVPVGRPIRLLLSSEDVIHSFFVPAFRFKQDAVPGKIVSAWFEPTRPGVYALLCAQFCGTKHSGMTGRIVVLTPEDYAAWLAKGEGGGDLAARGQRLFVRYGCSGCHAANSIVRAPPLEGLFGRDVPLADGTFVHADEQYLVDSMLEPAKQVAAGYAPVMPVFKGVIPEGDLLELVAYLKSLRAVEPRPAP